VIIWHFFLLIKGLLLMLEQANEKKEKYRPNGNPAGAILCKKPMRRLEVNLNLEE
jgi:hypothetical protein